MKNLIYLALALVILSSCNDPLDNQPEVLTDSISMGAGYANDIYYSLENGIVKTSQRDSWDIAFSANPMSSTVLINEGYGVELYAYPNGDMDAWDNIDTSDIATWPKLFNSDSSWYFGAFDRNQSGHPDYGWGVYNDVTHDVMGDSLFIIKLSDGSYQKLFIEQRGAMTNSFTIKYGNIDEAGSTKEVACSEYSTKNFLYYSLTSSSVVDNEPASDSWDIVFTKYHDESIPYIVTGILSNMDMEVAEVSQIDPDLADPNNATFTSDISTIGSDWKEFDMGTFSYVVAADRTYFVKKGESDIYKIVLKGTDGSASGKVVFEIEKPGSLD